MQGPSDAQRNPSWDMSMDRAGTRKAIGPEGPTKEAKKESAESKGDLAAALDLQGFSRGQRHPSHIYAEL